MKRVKSIFLVIIVVLVVALASVLGYLKSVVPDEVGMVSVSTLSDTVEVRYDHYGVPHIAAQNDTDAFFALGYAVARERLFQMELLRRVGSGRLSEIFGKDLVRTDAFFKTLGFEKQARFHGAAFMTNMQGEWQRKASAYINGLNYFMANSPLPTEFQLLGIKPQPFTPVDMYLIAGYMAFSFTETLKIDPVMEHLKALGPEYYKYVCPECAIFEKSAIGNDSSSRASLSALLDQTQQSLPFQIWTGSNAFVVSSARSQNGSVLFANDTHIGYQQPAVWFEAHLQYPGMNLYGKYIAGMPFPLVAHNGFSSYGVTILENDDIQLYREEQVGQQGYRHKGDVKPFLTRKERIAVKGESDTLITIRETIHGPVITDVVDVVDSLQMGPVSLWWVYLQQPVTAFETTYGLATAKNMKEAYKAVSQLNAPGLNIAYGDTDGNIAVWAAAKIPVYPKDSLSKFIVDGSSGDFDITSYYPFDSNPHRINPSGGFVYTANEALDTVTSKLPGYYPPFDRANRLESLLAADSSMTISDMVSIMNDDVSDSHRSYARLLQQLLEPLVVKNASADELFGLFLLSTWQGGHGLDDPAPSVYYLTLAGITEMMMKDEMGDEQFRMFRNTHQMKCSYKALLSDPRSPWWDNVETKDVVETRDQIVMDSFKKAIRFLSNRFPNRRNWKWANMHTLEHKHALGQVKPLNKIFNIGPYAVPGGMETINNMSFHMRTDSTFEVAFGPAMRTIVDLGNPQHALSILPTGQSGHVMSRHYNDQAILHANGLYRPMLTNKAQIEKLSKGVLLLVPNVK
jgi:penicillin amidase